MKKSILALTLAAASSVALAQWVSVTRSEKGDVLYINETTIKKYGDMRRYWVIVDFNQTSKNGDNSIRSFVETDCKEERTRSLQEDYFRDQMGSGERLGGFKGSDPWRYIAPDTIDAALMRFVCSR